MATLGEPPVRNSLGQPVGYPVPVWRPRRRPPITDLTGRFCRLEALASRHAPALFGAYAEDTEGRVWTYLPDGPFETRHAFTSWVAELCAADDRLMFAIVDPVDGPLGMAGYFRIAPEIGSVEVGMLAFAPRLQRTPAATEAMFLMAARAFDELGYRRYEWKCDNLNAASQSAARRLGFRFEGVWRQATLYKGRNRDTAWFAMTDTDWAALRPVFLRWLDPANFDSDGAQRSPLSAGTRHALAMTSGESGSP